MNFDFPDELNMLRDTVRGYVNDFLRPLETKVETEDHLSDDEFRRLRMEAVALGLYGHNIPESFGGAGLNMLGQVVIGEEIGKTCMPLADAIGFLPASLTLARDSQRDWFVDPIVSGDLTVAYALTEPDAGSDLGGLKLRGRRSDGGWVLNGAKQFISGADYADFIIVLAVTDPDAPLRSRFTLFIVPRDNPGFIYTGNFRKMGWKGYQLGAFTLENCEVGEGHVLGEIGDGFAAMMATINTTRIEYSARYVGMADELLRLARGYVNERRAFGSKLGDHQAIQFMLADSDCEVEASRLLTYRAASLADEGNPDFRIAGSRSKLYASEMVGRVADRVLQIFGGAGYMCDWPVERMYRDARAFRIGEGTSEMQRIQIARAFLSN
ncbi:acyl-CoA dehydrogenase family protein [Brucella anthropi]|jgi:acyl-CoA dehydrogenase|uniref:acyl-CoA dehydrogenase family protein n=1 Tax=Brucella anthropi TaxID=529 RepID=UPI0017472A6D|nr:acyl-CoA dehydrogenase family protein [Brucella anthropi]QOD67110.1 acyl-CoA/acyl-ACP dehydrogenase [Ochrobactrum sp. MT180101]